MAKKKYKMVYDPKHIPLEGMQKIIIDLANGSRVPQNEEERELLKEIKDIEKRGNMLDIPLE